MTTSERKELIEALAQIYLCEKANNKVYQRESSQGYSIALGKLQGACMALKLDFEETKDSLSVFTRGKKKIITKVGI